MIRANKYFKITNTIETEKLFGMAKNHRKISSTEKSKILAMWGENEKQTHTNSNF